MDLTRHLHTFGYYLKQRFGQTVHKLSLAGDFTCPNRDGTLGRGGCTFCNVRSFGRDAAALSISQQLAREKAKTDRARLYLAYFQAYTSTYAEVETLRALYDEAMAAADVAGLCVGTRPDCVPDAALDLLAAYRDAGNEVWLELGLQTAHDRTQALIRRGHTLADYRDAVRRAHARGLKVCAHLIVGLPGEGKDDARATLDTVLDIGVEGLKLHPLMIVRGSRMAAQYRRGEVSPMALEDYADLAACLIRHTPPEVVYHRISATAQAPTLIAPDWCGPRWAALQAIGERLAREGGQGSALGRSWRPE
ncbi:TIGR01212 family radical SAM protein [Chromobacterium sinusclupearum]|uniref:TIGR01212 family radical SAM protein n=1 Tax=Chromobacterium sinusclupearum TaxID=2077146 RepID=A0A2K4MKW2_9NEIS|nr:TIGR01212 family radical SAM protein [Chromobacterium sinusclupearum]POA97415.1 TIGR01212 family radical SAM protein [Chromobacterium sinusclupearum]